MQMHTVLLESFTTLSFHQLLGKDILIRIVADYYSQSVKHLDLISHNKKTITNSKVIYDIVSINTVYL